MRAYKHYQTKEEKLRQWGRFFGHLLIVGLFIGYPFMRALSVDTYTGYFDPAMFGFLVVFFVVIYFLGYVIGREDVKSDLKLEKLMSEHQSKKNEN